MGTNVESATTSETKLKDVDDNEGHPKKEASYEDTSTLGNLVHEKEKIVTPSGSKFTPKRTAYSTAVRRSGVVDDEPMSENNRFHEFRPPLLDEHVEVTQSLTKEQLDPIFDGGPITVDKKHELSQGHKSKPDNASEIERTQGQSTTATETKLDDYDEKLKHTDTTAAINSGRSTTPTAYTYLADLTSVQNVPKISVSTDKWEETHTTSAIYTAKESYLNPQKSLPVTSALASTGTALDSAAQSERAATKASQIYKETELVVSSTADTATSWPALNLTTASELAKMEPKTDYDKGNPTPPPKPQDPSLQMADEDIEVQRSKGFPATEGPDTLSSTADLQSPDPGMSDDEFGEGAEKYQDGLSGLLLPEDSVSKIPVEPKFIGNVSDTKLSESDWPGDDQEKFLDEGGKTKMEKSVTQKEDDSLVIIREKLTTTTAPSVVESKETVSTKETEGSFVPTTEAHGTDRKIIAHTTETIKSQGQTTPMNPVTAATVGDVPRTDSSGGGCLRFDTGCSSDADSRSVAPVEGLSTSLPDGEAGQPVLGESNVALCITITLSHTWAEFCAQMEAFRHGVASVLSSELRANVRPRQVIIEDHCGRGNSRHGAITGNNTAVVRMHLMDEQDRYSQKLTALAAVILHHNDQGRIDLQMMNVCFYSGQHGTPSLMPEDARVYGPASSSVIASITISAIAGASLFLICILLVVMRQRLLNKHSTTNTVDGLSMASFKSSFRKKTIRNSLRSFLNDAFDGHEDLSSPVPFNNLPLIISNKEALEEEFKRIPMTIPRVDEVPHGAEGKNRYANVIPIPETRVHLTKKLGDETSDYINANYVRGYKGRPRHYIACQAPLPETVKDFWRMVWEQQCKVILMLTPCEENGVQRCAPYFPQNTLDCHKLYGDYQVSLQAKDVRPSFTLSTFKLHDLDKNLCRDVYHCWYTGWPPQGVPEDVSSVVSFLIEARRFVSRNQGPTVVHCSPGTGRTGTVLAVDVCMHELEERRRVDVPRVVFKLRQDRSGCVQTKEQYAFIYEALYDYSARIAMQSSQRPSVVSTA